MIDDSKKPIQMLSIIIIVIVALSFLQPLFVSAESQLKPVKISTWVLVPAVVTGLPHEEGKLINITITIIFPGNGTIEVFNEGGEVSASTKYSMATAVATAALLDGVDWTSFNTRISIHARGPISGPSGSLAIATAVYVLLNPLLNADKLHKYVITGAIAPEGLAGSVGGVAIKCRAAQKANYTFILPLSNIEDLRSASYNCTKYFSVTDIINIIRDIYKIYPIVEKFNLSTGYPKGLSEVMDLFTKNVTELTQKIIHETEALIPKLPVDIASSIKSNISSAISFLNKAEKYVGKRPYTAASFAYTAYVYALLAKYMGLSQVEGFQELLKNEIEQINSTLANISSTLTTIKPYTLERLELLSVSAARLADAVFALSSVESLIKINAGSYVILYQLALAKSRAVSIRSWLQSAEMVNGTIVISKELIKNIALKAYDFARLNLEYSIALLTASGLKAEASALETLLNRMSDAIKNKDWVLLLGYSREALSKATDYVFEYSIASLPIEEQKSLGPVYARNIETIAKYLSIMLALRGVRSPLAPAYVEYYKTLAQEGSYDVGLKLLWSAVSDLELLSVPFLSAPTQLLGSKLTPLPSSLSGKVSMRFTSSMFILMAISISIIAFALGYLVAIRGTLKEIEIRLRA